MGGGKGDGMNDENVLRALRAQAWERARGELKAVLATFFVSRASRPGQYEELSDLINQFVKSVDDEELAE